MAESNLSAAAKERHDLRTYGPCTLYQEGGMMGNIIKTEVRSAETWYAPYAQYPRALHLRFVRKGCRNACGLVLAYRPSLLILDGFGHPDPAGIFDGGRESVCSDGETKFVQSAHSSFGPGWARDFDRLITGHIETTGAKVLADFRTPDDEGGAQ